MDPLAPRAPAGDLDDLFEPGTGNEPIAYAKRVWSLRDYIWAEAQGRVESDDASTSWGNVWLYLEPLLELFIWFLIFGVGIRGGRTIPGEEQSVGFFVYLAVGMAAYGLMRRMFGGAANALANTRAIPFDFPRGVAVVSGFARAIYEYRFHLPIMLILVMFNGALPRLSWLLLAPLTVLASVLGAGIGFVLARFGTLYPTAMRFVDKLLRLMYWTAGIMIPIEGIILERANGEQLLKWYTILNPLYGVVKLHQWAVYGYFPPGMEYAFWSAPMWAAVLLVGGFVYLVRGEAMYREHGDRLG